MPTTRLKPFVAREAERLHKANMRVENDLELSFDNYEEFEEGMQDLLDSLGEMEDRLIELTHKINEMCEEKEIEEFYDRKDH